VIIVNHYAEAVIGDCLAAIVSGKGRLDVEVILVDNPSDPAAALAIPADLGLKRVAAPRRLGFGAACNLGAGHASATCLLFLNPDVIVTPAAIETLYLALESHPAAGAAAGRLTFEDGSFQPSCRRFPTVRNLVFSRGSVLYRFFKTAEQAYTLPDYPDVTEVEAAAAAMMMIRKALFDRLQGFDESFFMYMEDTDLCFRARACGGAIIYVPRAGAVHRWGFSTGRYRFRRIIWHHRAFWRYFARHRPTSVPLLLPLLAANCCLSLLLELFTFRA